MLQNVTKGLSSVHEVKLLDNACKFYYLGDYDKVLDCPIGPKNAPYIIAAAIFRGEHTTGRRLFKEYKESFNYKELIFTNFHLGLSFTRTSDYPKAKKIFLESWSYRKNNDLTGIEKFYIYQGLSFFRFFFSRHESSLFFADLAENELLKEKKIPALLKALVYDLQAHNLFQLGRPNKGLLVLRKAIQTTQNNNLHTLESEFRASSEIYSSQYSLGVNSKIKSLKRLLKTTPDTNDYTCSELVLQISMLYLLKGSYYEANDFLIKNFKFIYENDNKRKVAKLNTLLAQLLLPKRQFIEALSLLKVAKSNLSDLVDINLLAPILAIESQILVELGQSANEQQLRLDALTKKTDKGILKQVSFRLKGEPCFNEEDQLGVLFDKVHLRDESCLNEIIENELFYLARKFFGPFKKKRTFVIHPKNIGIFFFSEEKYSFHKGKISKNQLRFLSLLNKAPQTKESLIKEIWGYTQYDPLRHDHLVYTLVRRTRSFFNDRKLWIQSSEDLYFYDTEVEFKHTVKFYKKDVQQTEKRQNRNASLEDLNFRQVQILDGAFSDGFSASEVAAFFKTTRMTSFRDLEYLLEKGLILKRGKSRGTRYILN